MDKYGHLPFVGTIPFVVTPPVDQITLFSAPEIIGNTKDEG